jgi:hypothetical protein
LTFRVYRRKQPPEAQVAELVDALVSGTSGASRGGSSPLLGTKSQFATVPSRSLATKLSKASREKMPKICSWTVAKIRVQPVKNAGINEGHWGGYQHFGYQRDRHADQHSHSSGEA